MPQFPSIPRDSWWQVGQQLPGSCTVTSPCRRSDPRSTQENGPMPSTTCLSPKTSFWGQSQEEAWGASLRG